MGSSQSDAASSPPSKKRRRQDDEPEETKELKDQPATSVKEKKRKIQKQKVKPKRKVLKIKRLVPHAYIPTRNPIDEAGLNLCSIHHKTIFFGEQVAIQTGIVINLPKGMYGQIVPNPELMRANRITCQIDTIGHSFKKEIIVYVKNENTVTCGDENIAFLVTPGMCIARFIVPQCPFIKVEEIFQGELKASEHTIAIPSSSLEEHSSLPKEVEQQDSAATDHNQTDGVEHDDNRVQEEQPSKSEDDTKESQLPLPSKEEEPPIQVAKDDFENMSSPEFAQAILGDDYTNSYEAEDQEHLKQKVQLPLQSWRDQISSAFMSMWTFVDTNALITIVLDGSRKYIIIGMGEVRNQNFKQFEEFCTRYFEQLASLKDLEHVQHYFMAERNYGTGPFADSAWTIAKEILPNTIEYCSDPPHHGVWPNREFTIEAFTMFGYDLSDECVSFCSDWISSPKDKSRQDLYLDFFSQLSKIKRSKVRIKDETTGLYKEVWKYNYRHSDLIYALACLRHYVVKQVTESHSQSSSRKKGWLKDIAKELEDEEQKQMDHKEKEKDNDASSTSSNDTLVEGEEILQHTHEQMERDLSKQKDAEMEEEYEIIPSVLRVSPDSSIHHG